MVKKLSSRVPSYRRHKPTGQAVVTIDGRDFYLGTWNTKASKVEYDRLIAEWIANGRQLRSTIADTTVVEIINGYRKFAESYYRKNGEVTREFGCIKEALKLVKELYGRTNANEFGPLALKVVRQKMIDRGWSRGYINKSIGRIRTYGGCRPAERPIRRTRTRSRVANRRCERTDHPTALVARRGRYDPLATSDRVPAGRCLQPASHRR